MKLVPPLLAIGLAVSLAGCTATAAAPQPTVTVTSTVTATSATTIADRSGDSPIDSYDAYYYCLSQVFQFATGTRPPYDEKDLKFAAYSPDIISGSVGDYVVQLRGKLGEKSTSSDVFCEVKGTVANPKNIDYLYPR